MLVVLADGEENCAKSFRNIAGVTVLQADDVGVADVIGAARLVVSEAALARLTEKAVAQVNARQVIIRPGHLREELRPARGQQVHVPRARRREQDAGAPGDRGDLRRAREGVRTAWVKPKPKRRGFTKRAAPAVEEGGRDAPSRGLDRAVRGPGDRALMAIKKHKPTSPGRRFATWLQHEAVTKDEPEKALTEGLQEVRRAQRARARHLAPPRRRRQAQVPQDRLQAAQGRRAGQGRRDRVRPEPHGAHRAAPLRRRREALHPRAGAARRWATRCRRARTRTSRPATRCRWRTSRPAPRCTTSS